MRQVYIIETKDSDNDWTAVVAFPGVSCIHRRLTAAREAATTMEQYDKHNAPGETPIVRYRAVKYGPCK